MAPVGLVRRKSHTTVAAAPGDGVHLHRPEHVALDHVLGVEVPHPRDDLLAGTVAAAHGVEQFVGCEGALGLQHPFVQIVHDDLLQASPLKELGTAKAQEEGDVVDESRIELGVGEQPEPEARFLAERSGGPELELVVCPLLLQQRTRLDLVDRWLIDARPVAKTQNG